jgi:hypothetical protein
MITLNRAVRTRRQTLWLWNWRRNTRNRTQLPLNAWGHPEPW